MPEQHPISLDSPEYTAAEALRHPLRALRKGKAGMVAEGTRYNYPYPGESLTDPTKYAARLRRTDFYPFVEEAVGFAVGQVFSKEVDLGEDVPPAIKTWGEDVDLRGNNLHVFLATTFEDYWWTGAGVWLVDMPPAPRGTDGQARSLSEGEARAAGRRPFWLRYDAADVVDWAYEFVGGRRRLVMVKLQETATVERNPYGGPPKTELRRRVFWASHTDANLGEFTSFEVWAKRKDAANGQEQWVPVPEEAGVLDKMPEIPLVVLGDLAAGSPLQHSADLNISDWNKQSNLDNIEFVANVPVPVIASGTGPETDENGNRRAILWAVDTILHLPQGSTYGYFEHGGQCITHLKSSIAELRKEQGRRAMRSLMESVPTGDVTATSDIITSGRTFSRLQLAALRLQDAIELGLKFTAQYAGIETGADKSGGSAIVNRKFMAMPRDAQVLEFLKWMKEQGLISGEAIFELAQGALEIVPDELVYEDEQEKVEAEKPADTGLRPPPVNGQPPALARVRAAIEAAEGAGGVGGGGAAQ